MAIEIGRIRVITSGWQGGPGMSQLYFTGSTPGLIIAGESLIAVTAARTLYNALRYLFPSAWSAQVQPVVQVIEATTGAIIREEGVAAPAVTTGSASGAWGSTASGLLLSWHTSAVFGRKLLRGRTFMTPVAASQYDTTGQLTSGAATTAQGVAAAYAAAGSYYPCVWHRPHPLPTSANGGFGTISAVSVDTKETILRSRRD